MRHSFPDFARHAQARGGSSRRQAGVTTLAITVLLLVIVTVIVLFATNVAFFEIRTTTSESRSRVAEQAAEYAVNIGGEWIRANRDNLISDETGTGWLSSDAPRWVRCVDALPLASTMHPCMSERDNGTFDADSLTDMGGRRAQLYYYTEDGSVAGSQLLPYDDLPGALSTTDTGDFAVTTEVRATLCRIDTSLVPPECRLEPVAGNRIAVTLVAGASLDGEAASAVVKETWATFSEFAPSAAVPLVASGFVEGVGNATIVAAPNAGGFGLAATIWSGSEVSIEDTGSPSVGSVATCHLGGYLGNRPLSDLLTVCPFQNNACNCPSAIDHPDFLSGHVGAAKVKREDILDPVGNEVLPPTTFFPGKGWDDRCAVTPSTDCASDDSLFEWIFNVDYEMHDGPGNAGTRSASAGTADTFFKSATNTTNMDCGDTTDPDTGGNCALYALKEEYAAEFITCDELNDLGADASGIYYITDSSASSLCTLPGQVGSPDGTAIVVLTDQARLNNSVVFGMVFVRSNTSTAVFRGGGRSKVFGSVVVEGTVDISGNLDLVYLDTSQAGGTNKLPKSAVFGRVSGSWLDNDQGF